MGSARFSVRGLAAMVAACGLACFAAASAGAAQLAVVANRDSGEVSVVDTATDQVLGQIAIGEGKEPAAVAVTPDGRYAYVTDANAESVSVIDTKTRGVVGEPIEVGSLPYGIAITPDGTRAFVVDRGSHAVSIIDTQTKLVVRTVELPTGSSPAGIAVSPDGKFVYVTDSGVTANSVEVIDTETLEVVGEPIEVGEGPEGVEFSPDGGTAFVVDRRGHEVSAIDTATREVTPISLPVATQPRGIAVAPDGREAFVVDLESDSVSVIDTATDREVEAIGVGAEPQEVAVSANGKTVYVTEAGTPQVQRIDVESGKVVGPPIAIPGEYPAGIALTPDQSPTAAFAVPSITAGVAATFSGAGSSDPDGTIASYAWAFGDGKTAAGVSATHVYGAPGTYKATLSVVDDLGCGEEEVFTGRTAYCSGGASSVTHPVIAKAPSTPQVPTGPSNAFGIRRIVHNRRNGTVRMQVRLHDAGSIVLFGRKVHIVYRKSKGTQSMWLTIHPRVELNRRLKRIHHASVRIRITFTPHGGKARTVHRSVTLVRTPHPHRRRHGHSR